VFRNRRSWDYIANYDLDELILPKDASTFTIPHLLRHFEDAFPKAKAFILGEDFYPLWLTSNLTK